MFDDKMLLKLQTLNNLAKRSVKVYVVWSEQELLKVNCV